jgi:hypothetical protein
MNRTNPPHKNLLPSILLIILAILLTAGCSGEGSSGDAAFEMASMEQMPPDVQSAPVSVQQAYQFAFANPDVLQQIPCYCGCGAMGHTSNLSCYVSGADASGQPAFDSHALGCSICVDITQDTMRLLEQGQSVPEIRDYVDQTYAQYGPSNMP